MLAITSLFCLALLVDALPARQGALSKPATALDIEARAVNDAASAKKTFNTKRRSLAEEQEMPVRLIMLRRRHAAKSLDAGLLVPVKLASISPVNDAPDSHIVHNEPGAAQTVDPYTWSYMTSSALPAPSGRAQGTLSAADPYDWSYISSSARPMPSAATSATTDVQDPYTWNYLSAATPTPQSAFDDDSWAYMSTSAIPSPTGSSGSMPSVSANADPYNWSWSSTAPDAKSTPIVASPTEVVSESPIDKAYLGWQFTSSASVPVADAAPTTTTIFEDEN